MAPDLGPALESAKRIARRTGDELAAARALRKAGFFEGGSPKELPATIKIMRGYGRLGGAVMITARANPERVGLIDERGELTYAQLDARTNALAKGLAARGLRAGDGIAILARNHRGLVETILAAFKLGACVILLNTDFAGPQVREVADREGARMLVHDAEYSDFVAGLEPELGRLLAWTDAPDPGSIESMIEAGDGTTPPPPPERTPSIVILTSGTTGSPKGANREDSRTLTLTGAIMDRVPFRAGDTTVIAAPIFHSLGFLHAILAIGMGSTIVVRRRFKADVVLDDMQRTRATGLIVVPIMLQRIVEAQEAKPRDVGALRIVFVAGSQLGAALATRALDALGEVVHNLYGSTEVAFASIATPQDLRVAPDTVGRPTIATRVKLYDDAGKEITTPGVTGRIFVANAIPFGGYTGGGTKQLIDGLMSSGDVGHFDAEGRLYIDGRDDAMIVSGGENVFPDEIEELLTRHPKIDEATVLGVPDEQYGQRLRAFVVVVEGETLSADDVKLHVKENLARFKVPRDVVFLDAMPRNPTGKILKRELVDYEVSAEA